MRKILFLLLTCVLLGGCAAAPTFETLGPVLHQPEQLPAVATTRLSLPESAALQTLGGGTDKLYECDGYTLILQTLAGGDLTRTVRSVCGFDPEKLTLLETASQVRRYDWAWTAMGDGGELICRAAVLDDGVYHYCLTVFAPAASGGALAEQWNGLFASFGLDGAG